MTAREYAADMFKLRLLAALLLCAFALGMGLMLGGKLGGIFGGSPTPRPLNSAAILKQVQGLSQLVTVKYVLEKVVGREEPAESTLGKMFSGQNRVLLLAHGVVKAGVDLEKLQTEDVQVNGSKLSIKLPPAQIFDVILDEQETQVIERTTGLFRPFDKQLEQTVRQMAVDDLRRAARTGGILKEADDRAREQLKNFFLQLAFTEVEFR